MQMEMLGYKPKDELLLVYLSALEYYSNSIMAKAFVRDSLKINYRRCVGVQVSAEVARITVWAKVSDLGGERCIVNGSMAD